jgi:hypothetical protein
MAVFGRTFELELGCETMAVFGRTLFCGSGRSKILDWVFLALLDHLDVCL